MYFQFVLSCLFKKYRILFIYLAAVTYQWIKENTFFIRTDKQKYMFISSNGRLYFSEVTRDDEGLYSCLTTLTSISGTTLATTQPPSRVSMPIQLIVQDKRKSLTGSYRLWGWNEWNSKEVIS